jgi:hypothetical protein
MERWYALSARVATAALSTSRTASSPTRVPMRLQCGPPSRLPNTVALIDQLFAGGLDERFEFGLDVLVRGLAAQADGESSV